MLISNLEYSMNCEGIVSQKFNELEGVRTDVLNVKKNYKNEAPTET